MQVRKEMNGFLIYRPLYTSFVESLPWELFSNVKIQSTRTEALMSKTTIDSTQCWVSGRSVSLKLSRSDEQGRAVHEECYLMRMKLEAAAQNATPKAG